MQTVGLWGKIACQKSKDETAGKNKDTIKNVNLFDIH